MPSSRPALAARPHLFEVERPTGSLPRYLFRRGDTLYFKRKIPADVAHGFAEVKGQIWKSLGTSLVEKAKVLLAVEVTEFDLKVAELRREKARLWATDRRDAEAASAGSRMGFSAGPSSIRMVPAPQPPAHATTQTAELTASPVPQRAVGPVAASTPSSVTRRVPTVHAAPVHPQPAPQVRPVAGNVEMPAVAPAATTSRKSHRSVATTGPARPSMLHLLEDWKRKQTRLRTMDGRQPSWQG